MSDRFDFVAERSEGARPQSSKNLGIAPLAAAGARSKLAFDDPGISADPPQSVEHHGNAEAKTISGSLRDKRTVGASVLADQIAERVGDGLNKSDWYADWEGNAEAIPEAGGVFDDRPARLSRNLRAQHPIRSRKFFERAVDRLVELPVHPLADLGNAQRPQNSEQVDDPLNSVCLAVSGEALQFEFGLLDDPRIQ